MKDNLYGLSERHRRILEHGVRGGDGDTITLPSTSKECNAKATDNIKKAQDISKAVDGDGRDFTAEERKTVTDLFEEARAFKRHGDELDGDASLKSQVDDLGRGLAGFDTGPRLPGGPASRDQRKSLGQRFLDDDRIKAWMEQIAPGGRMPSEKTRVESPAIEMGGFKEIVAGGDPTTAGPLVWPDFLGLMDQGLYRRPLRIRPLLSSGQTTSDTVEFVRELLPTNAAAPVPEAQGSSAGTASGDVAGTKPESTYELERVTEPVKTIAHWLPATKRALADAAQVRTLIDTFLQYGLEEKLEDQVVQGDGTGENFTGIMHTSGTQAMGVADVTAADPGVHTHLAAISALRIAKRKVLIGGRAIATAHVLNPIDNEKIDLARDTVGNFYFGGPASYGVQTAWGIPRVESEAVPVGTAITAAFDRGIIWDREQATVAVSDSHADFFIRNLVAILAELRMAFGIFRPSAFCIIDLASILAM
jgi:HK97 family phage major capsid protein